MCSALDIVAQLHCNMALTLTALGWQLQTEIAFLSLGKQYKTCSVVCIAYPSVERHVFLVGQHSRGGLVESIRSLVMLWPVVIVGRKVSCAVTDSALLVQDSARLALSLEAPLYLSTRVSPLLRSPCLEFTHCGLPVAARRVQAIVNKLRSI